MPRTAEQTRWFRLNPGRLYHLTAVSPSEAMRWPAPPPAGSTARRITRFEDGKSIVFQTNSEEIPENIDAVLERTFGRYFGEVA